MNWKNQIKKSWVVLATLVCAVLFTGCSKKDEYCNVIPEDAAFVARLSGAELLEKNGLSQKEFFKKLQLPGMIQGKVEEIVAAGVDFEAPVYLYATKQISGGAVFKVKDAKALQKYLGRELNMDVREDDGIYWVLEGNGNSKPIICFDEDKLLVYGSMNQTSKYEVEDLMEQDADKSILKTDLYKQLMESGKPCAMIVDYKAYMKLMSNLPISGVDANMLSIAGAFVPDCNCLMAFDIEGGKLTFSSDIYANSDKAKEQLDRWMEMCPTIEGDFVKTGMEKPLFWGCMNFDGAKYLSVQEKEIPFVGQALEQVRQQVDVDAILGSFQGDVCGAFAMNAEGQPDYLVQAKMKNDAYLKVLEPYAEKLGSDVQMDKKDAHHYTFTMGSVFEPEPDVYDDWDDYLDEYTDDDEAYVPQQPQFDGPKVLLSHDDNVLTVTNNQALAQGKGAESVKVYASDIKGSLFFGVLDLQELIRILSPKAGLGGPEAVALQFAKDFKDVVFKAEKKHGEIVVHMNEDKEFFPWLFDLVAAMI